MSADHFLKNFLLNSFCIGMTVLYPIQEKREGGGKENQAAAPLKT
jgi:hypothetical protein